MMIRGQLGHGNHDGCSKPIKIEALWNTEHCYVASQISAGGTHSGCVMKDGSVYMWGDCTYGQLGLGEGAGGKDTSVNIPKRVYLSKNEPLCAKKLSLGGMHTAVLMADHKVVCFGRADSGQLGIGSDWIMESSIHSFMGVFCPKVVGGELEGVMITYISCGAFHTACCSDDGRAFTWGKEDYGALGCDNEGLLKGGLMVPHQIKVGASDIYTSAETKEVLIRSLNARQIECGGWHTVIVDECGVPWACGRGEFGRLGVGDEQSRREMVQLPDWKRNNTKKLVELLPPPKTSLQPIKSISLGGTHSLALLEDGSVYAWGRASLGRLGMKADTSFISEPTRVMSPAYVGFKAISISAGGSHNAAIVTAVDNN